MAPRDIIMVGASAGGFEAMQHLVEGLPPDFRASLFFVWHMALHKSSVLPQVLNRVNKIYASQVYDGELIEPNRIYVASPDHHLLVDRGRVRVTRGPKENRFRPAVDALFRSAAYAYGARVIGVDLTGALADGTAGLRMIKYRGGVAVVQDPLNNHLISRQVEESGE
jgi:two-component system chemotaxis response regulator CheB